MNFHRFFHCSELLTTNAYERDCRDYLLLLFKTYGFVDRSKIHDKLKLSAKIEASILQDYASPNTVERKWFLKFPTDTGFLAHNDYQQTKLDQDVLWSHIQDGLDARIKEHVASKMYSPTVDSVSAGIPKTGMSSLEAAEESEDATGELFKPLSERNWD